MERMHLEHFDTMPISALEHRHRYAYARRYATGTVLDIACGVGYGAEFLLGHGAAQRYHGVDYSAEAIAAAMRTYGGPSTSFHVGDITALSFADASFDAVFTFETLEHIARPELALRELKRVLRPGGVVLGSVPDGAFDANISAAAGSENEFHHHRFSRSHLEGLLQEHFASVQLGYAEVVIGSRIALLGGPAESTLSSTELTSLSKFSHGSFYFVCRDGAALPPMREDVAGYLPFFEDHIRWLHAVRNYRTQLDAANAKLGAARPPSSAPRTFWRRLLGG